MNTEYRRKKDRKEKKKRDGVIDPICIVSWMYYNVLQCSMLQCVAVCCSALRCVAVCAECGSKLQCVVVCCSVLQRVVLCCSLLLHCIFNILKCAQCVGMF